VDVDDGELLDTVLLLDVYGNSNIDEGFTTRSALLEYAVFKGRRTLYDNLLV
jgi:hypothetical protein